MKACVLYFSATGNTKKFAQAISNSLKIPLFNVERIQPNITKDYNLLIIGTPVHGMSPSNVISKFVEKLPQTDNKKTIIFLTYAIRKGKANEKLENLLAQKGYDTILSTSKRGIRFGEEAFEDNIEKIKKAYNLNKI